MVPLDIVKTSPGCGGPAGDQLFGSLASCVTPPPVQFRVRTRPPSPSGLTEVPADGDQPLKLSAEEGLQFHHNCAAFSCHTTPLTSAISTTLVVFGSGLPFISSWSCALIDQTLPWSSVKLLPLGKMTVFAIAALVGKEPSFSGPTKRGSVNHITVHGLVIRAGCGRGVSFYVDCGRCCSR